MSPLTPTQIEDLARTVASINQSIIGFYDNPENEKAYQDWYFKKFGHYDKESAS